MQIYILLTNNCNLSCSHCIRSDKSNSTLSQEEIDLIVDKINFEKNHIILTGGEASLHSNFEEILDKFLAKTKKITVCTNGINNYYFKKIKNSTIHLQFSIDGDRKYHNKIRGLDIYDKILENIQLAEEYNIKYSVSTVVNKLNINSMNNMLKDLEKIMENGYIRFNTQMNFGNSSEKGILSIEEWNNFVNNILQIRNNFSIPIRANKLFDFEAVKSLNNEELKLLSKKAIKNCGNCTNKVYIYPNLNVYSCTCLESFPVGNLKENNLENILLSKEAQFFINYSPKLESTCMECRYLELCNGGCIGTAFKKYGEFGHRDPRCPKINKQ